MLAAEYLHGAFHAGRRDGRPDAAADSGRAGRRVSGAASKADRAALDGKQLGRWPRHQHACKLYLAEGWVQL